MSEKVYLVYNTTHETLKAESLLRDRLIRVRPVIKPVRIKSSCGMALEIDQEHIPDVLEINNGDDFTFIGFFRKTEKHWKKINV